MPSLFLEHLTWVEAEAAFARTPTVLLPIGAILKEHGPHLPLNADYLLAIDAALVRQDKLAAEIHPWMQQMRSPVRAPGPLVRKGVDGVGSLSASGVIGDPTRASAAKGEAILSAMAGGVAACCVSWA